MPSHLSHPSRLPSRHDMIGTCVSNFQELCDGHQKIFPVSPPLPRNTGRG